MTSTGLKLLALALMTIDHIGEFIPHTPLLLRYLGRLSAPLFVFCSVWGFHCTHSKPIYLLRLYCLGAAMSLMNFFLNRSVYHPYCEITNNIFTTLFLISLLQWLLSRREKRLLWLAAFSLWQLFAYFLVSLSSPYELSGIAAAVTASIPHCEGGLFWVLLGVGMGYFREDRKKLGLFYGLCCTFLLLTALPYGLLNSFQWMMIFSLPLMLCYNGQRGKSLKALFYLYYPAHIAVLFVLGNALR